MQEQQTQDEKLLLLPVKVLSGIKFNDFIDYRLLYQFFQTAYLDLSGMELFDERTYRESWQENLMHLSCITEAFDGYTKQEIQQAVEIGLKVLEKNRKEVSRA